jgi:ribosomal protein L11 methylase PrmA
MYDGKIYRQVNRSYAEVYEQLMASGLYADLTQRRWLVAHQEVKTPTADSSRGWRTLFPEQLRFVSYPYEWSFSQLQDAALLTLDIQIAALGRGMSLKDASAYNIQFHEGRPVFIDTLSFESYVEGRAWVAYRQFCRHFLVPLALMAGRDVRLQQLLRVHLDGIPLDLGSALLPWRSWLRFGLAAHIHLHWRSESRFSATDAAVSPATMRLARVSRSGMFALLDGLRSTVAGLDWNPGASEWGDYYGSTNYTQSAMSAKATLVNGFLEEAAPLGVWDLGANTGVFSRLAAERGIPTIAFDIDPVAVEKHYLALRAVRGERPLPLLLDLGNPSASIGWHHAERMSLRERGPADCVMALALIHHLCIGNNLPLGHLADFFADICGRWLIIEFVPKADAQVQRLLRGRADVFADYDHDSFEVAFAPHFELCRARPVGDSGRTLYLMRKLTT